MSTKNYMQRNEFTLLFYKIEVVKFLDDQAGDDICKDYDDPNVKKYCPRRKDKVRLVWDVM